MLIIEKINCSGSFSFGFVPTIQLCDVGLVYIRGINEDNGDSSNASGKSSIINVIKHVFFGRNDTGKSGHHIVNKHIDWDNGCFLCTWFKLPDTGRWRAFVVEGWKGNPPDPEILQEPSEILMSGEGYKGTDVFLERWDGTKWKDERSTSIGNKRYKDTQAKLIKLIGMTYEQFSSYVCLGQEAESALVSGTSGEREKIIQAVSDVSVWENAANIIKQKCTQKDLEIQQSDIKLLSIKQVINTISQPTPDDVKQFNDRLQAAKDAYNTMFTKLEDAHTTFTSLQSQMESFDVNGIMQEMDILSAEERHARDRFGAFESLPEPTELTSVLEKRNKLSIEKSSIDLTVNRYKNLNVGKCPNCGQDIVKDKLDQEISRLSTSSKEIENVIYILSITIDNLDKKWKEDIATRKKEIKDKFDMEMYYIEDARNKLNERKSGYDNMKQSMDQLCAEININNGHLSLYESNIRTAQESLNELNNRTQKYNEILVVYNTEEYNNKKLKSDLTHMRWVERNLRKVKLDEYSYVIERLNQLVSEELLKIWGTGMSVRFVNAKEKVTGGIKVELDLLVSTPKKDDILIELCSGGEKKCIVIATFRAVQRLINECGKSVNISAIDEIDKDLDDYHTDKLVDALDSVINNSPTCIVISHNSRLLNTIKFNNIWTVHKKNEMSSIELAHGST